MVSRSRACGSRGLVPTVVAVVAVVAVALGGCGSSSATSRPTTKASLQIVSPAPGAVTGPDVPVTMRLERARVVRGSQIGGALRPDRGHVHLSVDGTLVSMPYDLDQTVTGLGPGSHTVQAEFVAVDHEPFANRVVASVTFTVG